MVNTVRSYSILALLAALAAGAATPARAENYFAARARDLRDILILDLGVGDMVAEIDVRATDYLTFCVGAAESKRWRLLGKWIELKDAADNPRHQITRSWLAPSRLEANVGVYPALLAGWGNSYYPRTATWISTPEFLDLDDNIECYVKNWLFVDDYPHNKPWTEKFDVAAGATIPFLAARIGFSAGNLVDFLAGLAGLDPAGDDER